MMISRTRILCCIVAALILSDCGLEPKYALQTAASTDGTFLWVDAFQKPPAGYLPVGINQPGADQRLGVCRAMNQDDTNYSGYLVGEVRPAPQVNTLICSITRTGPPAKLTAGYQRLWAKQSASYDWIPLAEVGRERPLELTRLWRRNHVPLEPVVSLTDGRYGNILAPCASNLADGWHIGQTLLTTSWDHLDCYIPLEHNSITVDSDHLVVLYAPIDGTE